jgi:hypothetical protein
MATRDEFKFPDELEAKQDQEQELEIEIEIEDDTPEEDRNRAPMEEAPKEITDDELSKYDESVKKRIKHFSKGYHEERRKAESAIREKEEAIRLTQQVVEENKKLKGSLNTNQAALLEQAKKVVATEVDQARKKYKEAYESGDADAIITAQEDMTAAKLKAERVNNFRPAPLQEEEISVQTTPQPAEDPKALAWQQKNSKWFGVDDEMTSFALGLHSKLVKSGVDTQSDEYYERLNSRLRQVFPDEFESGKPANAQTSPRKSNVAPATRSTAPRKIVLTQTQVNLAKKLGVPLELYARKAAEEQMRK